MLLGVGAILGALWSLMGEDRFASFARWRVRNIAAGLLVGVIVCVICGPLIVAYGLASGHVNVALASLGMTVVGAASFIVGPAVLSEWFATGGEPGWRSNHLPPG